MERKKFWLGPLWGEGVITDRANREIGGPGNRFFPIFLE